MVERPLINSIILPLVYFSWLLLLLPIILGTNRTDADKAGMETDFVHPEPEQSVKPNSEDSSVVSDHSDNNNSEEVPGIKCTNLHSRLSGNSRKQKCPMRRYSGSGTAYFNLNKYTVHEFPQTEMFHAQSQWFRYCLLLNINCQGCHALC